MKTINLGKKEYIIMNRSELNRIVSEVDYHLCCCMQCANSHKENSDSDIWRDFDMNQIIASANNGRNQLKKLLCEEA